MAYKLKQAGHDNILLLEKASEVGGTWRENTYPGAECDIPSVLYSYSFAQNPAWDFKWAKQAQIFDYLRSFAGDNDLTRHICFKTQVKCARYNQEQQLWRVETGDKAFICRFLISAVGQLHHPNVAQFDGQESFAGAAFHSARWDHTVDLKNKRVAVIGCAASAIQLIPEVAKEAARLTVYQRSPNWVIDKGDRPYSQFEKWLAGYVPWIRSLYRFSLWALGEYVVYPAIRGARIRAWLLRAKNRWDMRKYIKDRELQNTLTPSYPIGAKRILFSDKFYRALAQAHVELVTEAITSIAPNGIRDASDQLREHDVIVYATGFKTNPFLQDIDITGINQQPLHEHWANGAFAYLGVATHGFPNMFMLYGPNTNSGHTSIVFKLERQADYIIELMNQAGSGEVQVDQAAEQDYNREIQNRLRQTAWDKVDSSWYKQGDRITNNWPGSAREYAQRLRTPLKHHFKLSK